MNIDFRVYLSYDGNILDCEEKEYFIKSFESILNQLKIDLKFPKHLTIIIPEDYEKELTEFQQDKSLQVGYTNNDDEKAYGKFLSYEEDAVSKYAIFIHKNIIFTLLPDDYIAKKDELLMLRAQSINLIHHELIHVCDEYICGNQYRKIIETNNKCLLNDIAVNVWKEYYACRLSASTYDINLCFINDVNDLLKRLEKVEESFKVDNWSAEELIVSMISILNRCAYLQGRIFQKNDYEVIVDYLEMIKKKINSNFFAEVWVEMFYELEELYNTYLNWDNDAFYKLAHTIIKAFEKLGVEGF